MVFWNWIEKEFQSAPPAWGAIIPNTPTKLHFWVSIRAPRVGGDNQTNYETIRCNSFNPRPPRGGRFTAKVLDGNLIVVSIRAPRVGGDQTD